MVSAADEHGRATVYTALAAAGLPWLGPVGRLDKASEGLLLLSNDTVWAAGITDPATHLDKTYHVQVAGRPDAAALAAMLTGIIDAGDLLKARRATLLRAGEKNAWLEVVLDEGRNRQIRRLLAALGFDVLRLIRVAIGPLALGELAKGQWRQLSAGRSESSRHPQAPRRAGIADRLLTARAAGNARPTKRCVPSIADHAQLPTHLGERGNGPIEMLAGMRRTHLRADARLALRHHRDRRSR